MTVNWPDPKTRVYYIETDRSVKRYLRMRSLIPDLKRLIQETII